MLNLSYRRAPTPTPTRRNHPKKIHRGIMSKHQKRNTWLTGWHNNALRILALAGTLIAFAACGEKEKSEAPSPLPQPQFHKAAGGKWYGGIFRLGEASLPQNLFPHAIISVRQWYIASQIFEGLFRLNPVTLEPEPLLARHWEVDSSRTTYTFYLRTNVYFHPSTIFGEKGERTLTANDVLYSLRLLCTRHPNNDLYVSWAKDYFAGCQEYYEGKTQEFKAVEVLNDSTVRIHLRIPTSLIFHILAGPAGFIFPQEAIQTHQKAGQTIYTMTTPIGTGPFRFAYSDSSQIILVAHRQYWRQDEHGNRLPFLQAIQIVHKPGLDAQVQDFAAGALDMVFNPSTSQIISLLETRWVIDGDTFSPIAQRTPGMNVSLLLMNTHYPPLDNPDFRRALNAMTPRQLIADMVMGGEVTAGIHGVVPPEVFPHYPVASVQGYQYNPELARQFLKRSGVQLPITLEYIVDTTRDPRNRLLAQILRDTFARYQIQLKIKPVTFEELIKAIKKGKFQLARVTWNADFPHPINFLSLFYGGFVPEDPAQSSYPNFARYKNPEFDKLYEAALKAPTPEESYQYLVQADQFLMDQAVTIVLWYGETYRILHPYVQDFPKNAMDIRDWSETYFVEPIYTRLQQIFRQQQQETQQQKEEPQPTT